MLHDIDLNKMNTLMETNKDAKQIITQLLQNHHSVVSTIAHEIRNPLTLVSSSLQVMEVQHPEVKDIAHWTQTVENVSFMVSLLEELSAFNNGNTLNYSVFSMERFLRNIAVSFAISLDDDEKDIEFSSSIPRGLGDFTGDKIKLEQVLLNLLYNARDAAAHGGRIYLDAVRSPQTLTIRCHDNGCGIPADKLESIFEPFVSYKENGTGLGLSLSRRIIEAHEGCLTAESSAETGTVFTIQLPV